MLTNQPIKLVIADDHPMTLMGLNMLINDTPDMSILATAATGTETLQAVYRLQPDVLLLDIDMPCGDGYSVLKELHSTGIFCKTVLYSYQMNDHRLLEAMNWGVRGIVIKTMPPLMLLQAIRTVHAGGQWLEPRSLSHALERNATKQRVGNLLTTREIELVKVVALGFRNQVIADKLKIQESTVRIHLHNIYKKLGLSGRCALIALAQQNGLC